VYSCTHCLRPRSSHLPPHLGSYTRALLVSQDRRHLFVTTWVKGTWRWECCVSLSLLKGHGNEADFLGFLHKSVRHRSLTLHTFRAVPILTSITTLQPGFFLAKLALLSAGLAVLSAVIWWKILKNSNSDSVATPRLAESGSRRLSDSLGRGVSDSPTRRVGESPTLRLS
jgi:hypothetical protein